MTQKRPQNVYSVVSFCIPKTTRQASGSKEGLCRLWRQKTPFAKIEVRSANCTTKQREVIQNERRKQFIAYKLELQISYCVCTEIPQKSILRTETVGDRRNSKNAMQLEKGEHHRSRSMSGSYSYAGRDSAEVRGVEFHGILEREKQPDDLRKISEVKIQVNTSIGIENSGAEDITQIQRVKM